VPRCLASTGKPSHSKGAAAFRNPRYIETRYVLRLPYGTLPPRRHATHLCKFPKHSQTTFCHAGLLKLCFLLIYSFEEWKWSIYSSRFGFHTLHWCWKPTMIDVCPRRLLIDRFTDCMQLCWINSHIADCPARPPRWLPAHASNCPLYELHVRFDYWLTASLTDLPLHWLNAASLKNYRLRGLPAPSLKFLTATFADCPLS
jgi:hypothetical protein